MTVIFVLVGILCFLIGAGFLAAAVLLFVKRRRLKKETGDPHLHLIAAECFALIPGISLLVTPIVLFFIAGNVVLLTSFSGSGSGFYGRYVDSGNIVSMDLSLLGEYGAPQDIRQTITINGIEYVCDPDLPVAINDHHRGDAIANLTDGETTLTVFRFKSDSGCDLISINRSVYCPVDQLNTYLNYYRYEADHSYQLKRRRKNSPGRHKLGGGSRGGTFQDGYFPDEMFNKLISGDPSCTERAGELDRTTSSYEVRQKSKDGKFTREMKVSFLNDGSVCVTVTADPMYKYISGEDTYPSYYVTDRSMIKTLKLFK